MKLHHLLLLAICFLLTACDRSASDSAANAEWERQNEEYWAQMKKSDEQAKRADAIQDKLEAQNKRADALQDKYDEQNRRYDRLLEKWEEQVKRMDAILDKIEKERELKK